MTELGAFIGDDGAMKALHKQPAQRHASAEALADALADELAALRPAGDATSKAACGA